MNLKHQRYLEARRAGLSIEECVKAALPGVDPTSERFQNWVATAETHIADIKAVVEAEGLNKGAKKAAKKTSADAGSDKDAKTDSEASSKAGAKTNSKAGAKTTTKTVGAKKGTAPKRLAKKAVPQTEGLEPEEDGSEADVTDRVSEREGS